MNLMLEIQAVPTLHGGCIAGASHVTLKDGQRIVVKIAASGLALEALFRPLS